MNRSAEHRLGQSLIWSKRAEAVLGAPTARFMAPQRIPSLEVETIQSGGSLTRRFGQCWVRSEVAVNTLGS